MRSVRTRLFVGLSLLVIATNVLIGLLAYRRAVEEATELQDAVLQQVGRFVTRTGAVPATEKVEGEAEQFRVVVEEFGTGKSGFLLEGIASSTPDGVTTVGEGRRAWRVLLLTTPDDRRFGIGQSTASRDERIRDTLYQTLVPALILLPCLVVLVGIIVQASFRPLSDLSARLDARATDDLRTLPTERVPEEIRPFVEAINRLLGRVGQTFEQRRRFVASAAHELRTPVTAITVQAENLSRCDLPLAGQERLADLQGGIRRVSRLLEQLLSLARYEDGPSGTAPVTALDMAARAAVAGFMTGADRRAMDLGFGRIEVVSVKADPTSLQVLIRNLVDNALRHASAGSQVDVEVFREGAIAVFRVTDGGPGIPPHELDRITDPFVRGGIVDGEGTGLGLSIVKSVAEACGGSLRLANRTDGSGGLVATVLLPAV